MSGGPIPTTNITFSALQTFYNNVNNPTDLANPIGLGEFRGCVLATSGSSADISFSYTGSVQTYTIPAGITSINIKVWAADGGSGGYYSYSSAYSPGGFGGYAEGDLAVSGGQTVYIYVGGRGYNWYSGGSTGYNGTLNQPSSSSSASGGWGGGNGYGQGGRCSLYGMAGGGAASHIRLGGTSSGNRKIIAGGGGGGGNSSSGSSRSGGGAGGGTNGETMSTSTQYGNRAAGVGGKTYAGTNAIGSWSSNMDGNAWYNAGSHQNLQGGGGGGYYGGGQNANSTGSGGGSGWIGGVTNGLMHMGNSGSKPANPASANPLTGDIDGLKHGYIKISYNNQTITTVPTGGASISIDSVFKGVNFTDMSPSMTLTAVGSSGSGVGDGDSTGDTYLNLTFISTEPTSDFDINSITVTNGTKSLFASSSSTVYTVRFTPNNLTGGTSYAIYVLQGAYTNNKTTIGCQNNASTQFNWTYQSATYEFGLKNTSGSYTITGSLSGETPDYSGYSFTSLSGANISWAYYSMGSKFKFNVAGHIVAVGAQNYYGGYIRVFAEGNSTVLGTALIAGTGSSSTAINIKYVTLSSPIAVSAGSYYRIIFKNTTGGYGYHNGSSYDLTNTTSGNISWQGGSYVGTGNSVTYPILTTNLIYNGYGVTDVIFLKS